MINHYTIPFFIPHEGCPHRCIFCDQNRIVGREMISSEQVSSQIEEHLATIPEEDAEIEVGFFGGTFTGLSEHVQEMFLGAVRRYIDNGQVSGIRLSTRPDLVDEVILSFLKKRGVKCIELGVQSMSDRVLLSSKRGHTSKDVERASRMIINRGMVLGHQMMLGLPDSTPEDEYFTAKRARELNASEVRIYPVVVIKGTELADMWKDKDYSPLTEEEAIKRSSYLILYFESNGIKVIRCGLHPSEGLVTGDELLDGPFHEAFRLKVESRIFSFMLDEILNMKKEKLSRVLLNPKDEAAFFGFERKNMGKIEKISGSDRDFFKKDPDVPRGSFIVASKSDTYLLDRKKLAGKRLPEEFTG
ncbi:MAG: radical SAM protein [Candidatus Omnitrophica bacterium]|nr:radical SAM protein [Candidatus Omnitrophota bacterium]